MGNTENTRKKIAARQAVKIKEAYKLCEAMCDRWQPKAGKGSHRVYFIGEDPLTLSKPKGDRLMPYQVKNIDDWLTRNGK